MNNAFQNLRQDGRYALRVLGQNPGFAAVAVLSLALGIGANTAIFSLVDAVLLKWLPVRSPQELVVIGRNPTKPSVGFCNPDYEYFRDHNRVYSGVIAYSGGRPAGLGVSDESAHGETQLVSNALVSGNYFDVLGVRPVLGRLFSPDDNRTPDAHPVAVLSYDFWQRRFARDTHVLGKRITLNGSPFTIVGVSRSRFTGTNVGNAIDVYVPIMELGAVNRSAREWNTRHWWWLTVIGRLKPGVSLRQATAEADVLFRQIEHNDPEFKPAPSFDKDRDVRNRAAILPGSQGYSNLRNRISKPLVVLVIVVGLVLLIACANVANLLLARAASRQKEIAIRLAVGASRGRLISQLLTETVILSLLGGCAGLALAFWAVRILIGLMPLQAMPIDLDVSPDARLLGFSFAVSLLTGMICGLAPALKATRPDVGSILKNDSAASGAFLSRIGLARLDLRKSLVVGQVALSLLLLIGAGLFVRSLENLRDLDPGFVRENVLIVGTNPAQSGYKGQRLRRFYDELLANTRSLPGVRAASLGNITPLGGSRWNSNVGIEGYQWKPTEKPYLDMNAVTAKYFETMGIPILLGRDFRDEDNPVVTSDPPDHFAPGPSADEKVGPRRVAIINETMAKRFFGRDNPLGRRLSINGTVFKMEDSYEIVGVVKDVRYFGLREPVESMIYTPVWRQGSSERSLCIRTASDPSGLIAAVRRQVRNLDSGVAVVNSMSMEQQFDNNLAQERIVATLCSFFGGLALLLSAVGLYGIMAHAVTRRTREIGIRMALGARRSNVLWLVLRDAILLVFAGAIIGVPLAFAATRFIESFLYGLTAHDPAIIVSAAAILSLVTVMASYLPARRATQVDPMTALRYE